MTVFELFLAGCAVVVAIGVHRLERYVQHTNRLLQILIDRRSGDDD